MKLPVRRRRLTVREDNFVADAIARHRLLAGPRRGARQSPAPGDERSVTDVIAEVPEREFPAAPRHAATVARGGSLLLAPPAGEAPEDGTPQPSWTPKPPRPHAETRPIPLPVAGRPYFSGDPLDPAVLVPFTTSPAIGDGLPALAAEPAQGTLFEASPSRPMAVLYTQPGWAGLQMSRWLANGEWDDVHAIAEQGLGRNAAENASAYRHSRETIAAQVRQRCAAIGRPDLAAILLRRTHELVTADRAAAAEAAAA